MTNRNETVRYTVAELQCLRPGFQRPLDRRRAKRYADAYDPNLERMPVVSVRANGDVVVLDGQHTVEMLRLVYGPKHVVICEPRYDLTYEQESRLFFDFQDKRRNVNSRDGFWSLIQAKDSSALGQLSVLKTYGFTITPRPGIDAPNEGLPIASVAHIDYIYTRPEGPAVLAETLSVIRESCVTEEGSRQGVFLRALATVIAKGGDRERLVTLLKSSEPQNFMRKNSGGAASKQCFERIISEYNKRLRRADRKLSDIPPEGWSFK